MMRHLTRSLLAFALSLSLVACASAPTAPPAAPILHGAAATVNPLATQAAQITLARGGNAIDAAAAAALMLNVVDGHNSGIGGGCLILIHLADGRLIAIDGRETAPAAATRNLYVHNGKADTSESKLGARASGVPGELAALDMAVKQYGRLPLADALNYAADTAEHGYPVSHIGAERLASVADKLRMFPASAAIFLDKDGKPPHEGDTLVQKDLANTFRQIAAHGADWFYRGPFAHKLDSWMKSHRGIMTAADLADYRARQRSPIVSHYRKYTIVGFPPPSSGGTHVAQILNILDNFDLAKMPAPQRAHVMVEAMKLAFADRAYWLGDSDFVKVPLGLTDPGYAKQLAAKIDLHHATEVKGHGMPPQIDSLFFGGNHTTHFSVADDAGNWVAITATINTSFGSKVVIPGTGVVMNNEMDDFSIQPGVPNAYGLVGAEANSVASDKRPLSSMSPTIVMDGDGHVVFSCGAAGGPTIITQVVQTIVNHVDLGMPLHDAVAAPRLHDQWKPAVVKVEKTMPKDVIEGLKQAGHKVELVDHLGYSQAVGVTDDGGFIAVSDPRLGP